MSDDQIGFDFSSRPPEEGEGPEPRVEPPPAASPPDLPGPDEPTPPALPALIGSLAALHERFPLERRLLVAATRGHGREALRQLAVRHGPWVGFEVTTPRPLALAVGGPSLAAEGLVVLDEFDETALLDEAIDEALTSQRDGGYASLGESHGFRRAARGAIQALRLGGVDVQALQRARWDDPDKRRFLARTLDAFQRGLARQRAADAAAVFERAIAVLAGAEGEGIPGQDGRVYLLPGLSLRGFAGRFLGSLVSRGAGVLRADPVVGLEPPTTMLLDQVGPPNALSYLHAPHRAPALSGSLDVFAAAGVEEELREVLRRIRAADLRYDEVEIVTPDASAYGSALHALSERLQIPVTFGVGLAVGRTRPGRAITSYFRWIEGGFPASEIRRMLEAGDLRPPAPHDRLLPMALARRFRELRVGWGRARYARQIERRLTGLDRTPVGLYDDPESRDRRVAAARREVEALGAILTVVLDTAPAVPSGAFKSDPGETAPATLAAGLRTFLSFVPAEGAVDATAMERVRRVLDRVERTLRRPTTYRAAAAALREHLSIRVPAPRAEGKAPWSSDGGALYLTDLEHGGVTGRRATFIVGMDSARFPGPGHQDPLLLDRERLRLAGDVLPTAVDRLLERRFLFASLLARLRGRVTVSYPAWEPTESRALAPSPEVLQVYRLMTGDALASFEDLRRAIGAGVGIVPRGSPAVDARDVWMGALAGSTRLLSGGPVVREAFPRLAAGFQAIQAAESDQASAYLGLVEAREILDPRRNSELVLSASRLEDLGSCPRRYLYKTVLRVSRPDDPRYDPERWLDALARGKLLHRVFERTLRGARERGIATDSPEFTELAISLLEREAERALAEHPTPSVEIHRQEVQRLRADARSFAGMMGEDEGEWEGLEVGFGLQGQSPIELPVPPGRVRLRGAMDRVDRVAGGLRVVDYKTGMVFGYGPEEGSFRGGSRMQNLVYWAAASLLFDEPIQRMEYHFPTARGSNQRVSYTEADLRLGPDMLGHLMEIVGQGRFLPTDRPDDCRLCDFKEICRVRQDSWGKVTASPALWSQEHLGDEPELATLRRMRLQEAEGPGLLQQTLGQWLSGGSAGG